MDPIRVPNACAIACWIEELEKFQSGLPLIFGHIEGNFLGKTSHICTDDIIPVQMFIFINSFFSKEHNVFTGHLVFTGGLIKEHLLNVFC